MILRLALRSLARSKTFVVLQAAMLAVAFAFISLAIGVADDLLFRPLPFRDSQDLTLLVGTVSRLPMPDRVLASWADLDEWAVALGDWPVAVAEVGQVLKRGTMAGREVSQVKVLPGFLTALGAIPAFGRDLVLEDDVPGQSAGAGDGSAVIISARLFEHLFDGDPGLLDRTHTVRLGEREVQLRPVGVLPRDFVFPHRLLQPDVLSVLRRPRTGDPTDRLLLLVARTPPSERLALTNALQLAASRVAARWPFGDGTTSNWHKAPFDRVELLPLRPYLTQRESPIGVWLAGSAAVVWVVVAGIAAVLARARSLASLPAATIHIALGATRRIMLLKAVVEGALKSLVVTGLALLISWPIVRWLDSVIPRDSLFLRTVSSDWQQYALVGAVSVTTLLLVSFASVIYRPALLASPGRIVALSQVSRRVPGLRVFVTILIAGVVTVVCVGAQILARAAEASATPLGFRGDRIITVGVNSTRGTESAGIEDLVRTLTRVPGVTAVGSWTGRLLEPGALNAGTLLPQAWVGEIGDIETFGADRAFFDVMQLPVQDGALPDADRWRDEPIAIVSETVAKRFWPGGGAVGRTVFPLHASRSQGPRTIVAVIGDARYRHVEAEPGGAIFVYAAPTPATTTGELLLRVAEPAGGVLAVVVKAIRDTSSWGVSWAASGDQLSRESLRLQRLRSGLAGGFASVGLVSLGIGVLGLFLLEVQHRRREFAIRTCVGATVPDIVWLVVRTTTVPLVIGVLGGLGVVSVVGQFIVGQTQRSYEVWPLLLGAIVVAGVVLVAAAIPALRSHRGSVAQVLRSDT